MFRFEIKKVFFKPKNKLAVILLLIALVITSNVVLKKIRCLIL